MKKTIILFILIIALIGIFSDKWYLNEKAEESPSLYNIDESYQKVADINEELTLYYGSRKTIVIESDKGNKILGEYLASFPEVSPDKERIAYIYPNEQDLAGALYIYNIAEDTAKIVIETDNKGTNTPKVVRWLDNQYVIIIVGYGYGHVSQGGSLYLYDTVNEKKILALEPEKNTEISDINLDGELITLDIVKWTDDNFNEYIIVQKEITYKDLLNNAKIENN